MTITSPQYDGIGSLEKDRISQSDKSQYNISSISLCGIETLWT